MEPSERRPSRLWGALKISVTVLLLGGLLASISAEEGLDALLARIGRLDLFWVGIAIALHLGAVLAGVLRWRGLLDAAGLGRPVGELARAFLVGRFVGAFTPSTTGLDGYRLYAIGRATGAYARSAAVIVIEKLVGLIGMALVCAAVAPFGAFEVLGEASLWLALALGGAALLGVAAASAPGALGWLAARAPARIAGKLERLVEALSSLRLGRAVLARATIFGVLSHLALAAVFWATARALGLDLSAIALLAVGNAIVIAVLLPISLGGVGVREGVAVVLLASVGVSTADATLVALLGYLTGQVPALLGGLLTSRAATIAPPAPVTRATIR